MIKNKNIKKAVKKVANKNRIILVIIKINNLEEIQDLIETFEENITNISEQEYIQQMNIAMKNYNAPRDFKIKMYGLIMSKESTAMSFFRTLARD